MQTTGEGQTTSLDDERKKYGAVCQEIFFPGVLSNVDTSGVFGGGVAYQQTEETPVARVLIQEEYG